VLALANTGERFGYYTVVAILLLFLQAKFQLFNVNCRIYLFDFLGVSIFHAYGWWLDR